MITDRSPQTTRTNFVFTQIAAIFVLLLGITALIGWWLNIAILKAIVPGSLPLKPNIAAGFIFCAAALWTLARERLDKARRIFAAAIAFAVFAIGGLTLGEHFFAWNLGIDQALVRAFPQQMGAINPARMLPSTAFCLVLIGTALFVESGVVTSRLRIPIGAGAGAALVIIGVLALGGFLMEITFGPQWNLLGMTVTGISAAAGFMALGGGVLALLQSRGGLQWSLDTFTSAGFAIGILLMVLTTAAAFTFAKRMLETNTSVNHRQQVLKRIQESMTALAELASSERIHTIVGDDGLLQGRDDTKSALSSDLAEIRQLTADNPTQQQRLDRLGPLIAERIEWEEQVIAVRRREGLLPAANMIATGHGITLTQQFQGILKEMQNEEYRLLADDRKGAETASTATFVLLPLGMFLSLTVLSLGVFFLNAGAGERKAAQARLRESEQRYRLLFESSPLPMWVYDRETLQFLAVNEAAIWHYGYSEEEFLTKTIRDIRPTEELSALAKDIAHISPGFESENQRLWKHRKKDGTIIDVEVTAHDLRFGRRLGRLVLANDVTARQQAEEEIHRLNADLEKRIEQRTAQLQTTNRELESFSYSVSHDLRAPLRHIEGYVELVVRHAGDSLNEKSRKHLQTVSESVAEMGQLIDDLLDFSRMGRVEMRQTRIDLDRLVDETIGSLETSVDTRNIIWKRHSLPPVEADWALLKQVFVNLLSNAVKYTRPRNPAEVEIGCVSEENGEAVLFVRDNGVGFDMKYAGKLFGVFQRLHHTDEFEGTGVGLATVQRIIVRHGGRVWADSTLDRGATFFFTLPNAHLERKNDNGRT
jgi:PAS domain S-box-containing protein